MFTGNEARKILANFSRAEKSLMRLKIVSAGQGASDPDVIAYKAREKQARQRAERRKQIEAQKAATTLAAKFPAELKGQLAIKK